MGCCPQTQRYDRRNILCICGPCFDARPQNGAKAGLARKFAVCLCSATTGSAPCGPFFWCALPGAPKKTTASGGLKDHVSKGGHVEKKTILSTISLTETHPIPQF